MKPFVWAALLSAILVIGSSPVEASSSGNKKAAKTSKVSTKNPTKQTAATPRRTPRQRPGSNVFLSHTEFTRLTKAEQKNYLRELKKILGSLPGESANFAKSPSTNGKTERAVASETEPRRLTSQQVQTMVAQAEAWRGEGALLNPALLLDSYARERHRERMRNSIWWLVGSRLAVNDLPESDPSRADILRRIQTLEGNYLDYGRRHAIDWLAWDPSISQGLAALRSARDARIDSSCRIIPTDALYLHGGTRVQTDATLERPREELAACEQRRAAARAAEDIPRSHDAASTLPPAPAPPAPAPVRPEGGADAEAVDPAAPVVPTVTEAPPAEAAPEPAAAPEPVAEDPPEPDPEILGYRCMYAGFVIQHDPCRGPTQLPEGISFRGVHDVDFFCDADQILCNPLLFGVVSECDIKIDATDETNLACLAQARPLCVSRGQFATRECATRSGGDKALESAAVLIRMNPIVWRDYRIGFFELCDDEMIAFNGFVHRRGGTANNVPERTLTDVRRTCENARRRLVQLVEQYRVDGGRPTRPSGTGTGTDGRQ